MLIKRRKSADVVAAIRKHELDGDSVSFLLSREMDQILSTMMSILENHAGSDLGLEDLLKMLELSIIIRILRAFGGHQRRAAKYLGLKPTTLNEKIKKYGLLMKVVYVPNLVSFDYARHVKSAADKSGQRPQSSLNRGLNPSINGLSRAGR